jgi:alcohol dehydrogenase
MFQFCLSTRVTFGCGARHQIGEILKREGWKSIGLVADHNLAGLEIVEDLIRRIENTAQHLVVGQCSLSEPTYDALEELRVQFCHPSLQAVIGLGGGSALDMAKAMAVLVHNPEPALHYRGFDKMTEPVLPIITVPTTAGTGSEVTPNASFIDTREKKKMGINGEAVRPRYALLDPELTLSCPLAPTLSAALDSMVHAVEAYTAQKTNPLARLFAREGYYRVARALPRLKDDLADLKEREEVMYGGFLSGVALMHSGPGPAAALSYPLGVHYGVPHGLGGAIFLPQVVEHNINQGCLEYGDLYQSREGDGFPDKPGRTRKFLEEMLQLWSRLDVPRNLQLFGLAAAGWDSFIRETLELKGALEQNPMPFGAAEIERILRKLTAT